MLFLEETAPALPPTDPEECIPIPSNQVPEEVIAAMTAKTKKERRRSITFGLMNFSDVPKEDQILEKTQDSTSLTHAPEEFLSITSLDISRRELVKVPQHVWEMRQLKILNLYMNKLDFFPPDIGV